MEVAVGERGVAMCHSCESSDCEMNSDCCFDAEVREGNLEDTLDRVVGQVAEALGEAIVELDHGRKLRLVAAVVETALMTGKANGVEPNSVATYAMGLSVCHEGGARMTRRFALEIVKRALGHR
jgi:hypothetical protein